ncbi:hypothetical protein HHE02_14160 [Helicobacter heilmannii]|nr:hypothetical protein HHE02_14160 [Helicobacter heilmannii]
MRLLLVLAIVLVLCKHSMFAPKLCTNTLKPPKGGARAKTIVPNHSLNSPMVFFVRT